MALVLLDRVKETSTTIGTSDYVLLGAVAQFQSFAGIGNGNTTFYGATDGTDWEVGVGTYTAAGTILGRTTILASSNGGAAVSWGVGTRTIWCDFPAVKVYVVGGTDVAVADGGTGVSTLTNHGVLIGQAASAIVATAAMTDGQLLVGQSSADPLPKTISGDVTVAASGAVSIGAGKITYAMISTAALAASTDYFSAAASRLLNAAGVWAGLTALSEASTIAVSLAAGFDFGGAANAPLTITANDTLGAPTNIKATQKGILYFAASTVARTLTLNAAWNLFDGVEVGPYSISTIQTVGIAYVCPSTAKVYVTSILRTTL